MTSDNTSSSARPYELVSVRLITDDVPRLAEFYECITGLPIRWATPEFAELVTPAGTVAIGSTRTMALFGTDVASSADNHSAIIEFLVDDVDAEYERIAAFVTEFVQPPTTMPWGNRSLLLRDPDGTLVNLFTPVSPDALAKFGR